MADKNRSWLSKIFGVSDSVKEEKDNQKLPKEPDVKSKAKDTVVNKALHEGDNNQSNEVSLKKDVDNTVNAGDVSSMPKSVIPTTSPEIDILLEDVPKKPINESYVHRPVRRTATNHMTADGFFGHKNFGQTIKAEVTVVVYENIEYTDKQLKSIESKISRYTCEKETENLNRFVFSSYFGEEELKFKLSDSFMPSFLGKTLKEAFIGLDVYLESRKLRELIKIFKPSSKFYDAVKCVRIIFVGSGGYSEMFDDELYMCQHIMLHKVKEESILTNYITLKRHEFVLPARIGFRTIESLEDTYL